MFRMLILIAITLFLVPLASADVIEDGTCAGGFCAYDRPSDCSTTTYARTAVIGNGVHVEAYDVCYPGGGTRHGFYVEVLGTYAGWDDIDVPGDERCTITAGDRDLGTELNFGCSFFGAPPARPPAIGAGSLLP